MNENYKYMARELDLRPKMVNMKQVLYRERGLLKPLPEVYKWTRFCKKTDF